jgi:myo-inositol-1(or 4)-monophosphatase
VDDAELAVAAAEIGAAVVRSRFGGTLTRIDKDGADFATDVDVEAEQAILRMLFANRPTDRVVAEESGHIGVPESVRCWLVDPLCGTVNYAARTGPVAVNVALSMGDAIAVAAVGDPLGAVVDWTDGDAAWRRSGGSDDRLVPSASSGIVDLNLDGPFPNAPRFTTAALLADPDFATQFRPRVVSTSLALAWVASGQRAGYVTDGHILGSVHYAAAIALCHAAGCTVTSLEGGPLHTGPGGLLAAADAATHQTLLAMATRQLQVRP